MKKYNEGNLLMKYTPDDILTRVFSSNIVGGYNKKEISIYLEKLAGDWEDLLRENSLLNEKVQEKERQLKSFRDREDLLKSAIITASRTADKIQEETSEKSREVLREAHQKADLIIQDARDSLKIVYQDLSDLRRVHIQLKNTLKAVLQSHQDLLEQDPVHTLLPQSNIDENEVENKVSKTLNQLSSQAKDLL